MRSTAFKFARCRLAAVVISLAAAALRLWQARESLWLDELHTAWTCGEALADVAPRAAIGNQSPLFFWLEWLIVQVLGKNELSLRLLSIAAGSLLPLAVFLLAARWRQRGAGLVAAALVTIDPGLIFTATEARPYAVVQLLAALHVGLSAELIANPRRALRMAWICLAAVLFYLHYTATLLIAAEVVWFVVARRILLPQTNYRTAMLACDLALLAAACAPAAGNVLAIAARRSNWESVIPAYGWWAIIQWWPLTLGSLYIITALISDRFAPAAAQRGEDDGNRLMVTRILPLCWLLVPATLAWLLSATGAARLFFPRYLAASAAAAPLIGGLCAMLAPGRLTRGLIGLLLIAACVGVSGIVDQVRWDGRIIGDRQEDWRSAVAWLNERLPEQALPILLYSGLIEAEGLKQPHEPLLDDYCLLPLTALYPVAAGRTDLVPLPMHEPGMLTDWQRSQLTSRGGLWLVARINELAAGQISQQLITDLCRDKTALPWRVHSTQSFGGVQVMRIAP